MPAQLPGYGGASILRDTPQAVNVGSLEEGQVIGRHHDDGGGFKNHHEGAEHEVGE